MGIYLGYVEQKESYSYSGFTFYNFKPVYEYNASNESFQYLNDEDRRMLLPESDYGNINFYVSGQSIDLAEYFWDKQLIFLDFLSNELEDNFNSRGERNKTGYRINTVKFIDEGKILTPDKFGYYQVIPSDSIIGDFHKDNRIDIEAIGLNEDQKVYLLPEDNLLLGPYIVKRRTLDGQFYVLIDVEKSKYVVTGISGQYESISRSLIDIPRYDKWMIIKPPLSAKPIFVDVCTDSQLLQDFREALSQSAIEDGKLDLSNIDVIIDEYNRSLLTGQTIDTSVRDQRLEKLKRLLTNEESLQITFDFLAGAIGHLLLKYRDSGQFAEFLKVLCKDDDFMSKVQSFRIVQQRIDDQERQLNECIARRDAVEQEIRQMESEVKDAALAGYQDEINTYLSEKQSLAVEIEALRKEHGVVKTSVDLNEDMAKIKDEITYLNRQKHDLTNECNNLGLKIDEILNKANDKMASIAFDGVIANKMIRQAAKWESEEVENKYSEIVISLSKINCSDKQDEGLATYLCSTVQQVRPLYDRNMILNIMICISQNFLTVFSGEPGTGKTSICNIVAQVLGLNKVAQETNPDIDGYDLRRFIPVSVERGWTSKRDFIGYYNPLTKVFDRSNRHMYDGLRILDHEESNKIYQFPFLVLLDEANLSPMEYYWADFMKICDGLDNCVNMGSDHQFLIPETLRFVATINNDHTTETLSPRLIDRSWIITLPESRSYQNIHQIPEASIDIISWERLKSTFAPNTEDLPMRGEAYDIYIKVYDILKKERLSISPRTDSAIRRYWSVAQKWFEKDENGTNASVVALDYAIAQKILPKINGNGDSYLKFLEGLKAICREANLSKTETMLEGIIFKGNKNMKYYQFFS